MAARGSGQTGSAISLLAIGVRKAPLHDMARTWTILTSQIERMDALRDEPRTILAKRP